MLTNPPIEGMQKNYSEIRLEKLGALIEKDLPKDEFFEKALHIFDGDRWQLGIYVQMYGAFKFLDKE